MKPVDLTIFSIQLDILRAIATKILIASRVSSASFVRAEIHLSPCLAVLAEGKRYVSFVLV